jgi:hypothetical protein
LIKHHEFDPGEMFDVAMGMNFPDRRARANLSLADLLSFPPSQLLNGAIAVIKPNRQLVVIDDSRIARCTNQFLIDFWEGATSLLFCRASARIVKSAAAITSAHRENSSSIASYGPSMEAILPARQILPAGHLSD